MSQAKPKPGGKRHHAARPAELRKSRHHVAGRDLLVIKRGKRGGRDKRGKGKLGRDGHGGGGGDGPPTYYTTKFTIRQAPANTVGADFVFLYTPEIKEGKCRDEHGKPIGACSRIHDVVLRCQWAPHPQPKFLVVTHEQGRLDLARDRPYWLKKGKKPPSWSWVPPRRKRYEIRKQLITKKVSDKTTSARALAICEFDRSTDPDTLGYQAEQRPMPLGKRQDGCHDPKEMKEDIVALTHFLISRTLQRASWARQELEFEPAHGDEAGECERARRVESLVRGTLLRIFPANAAATLLHLAKFEQTIAAFVAGELQMSKLVKGCPPPLKMDGIPDGSNLFAFAEAALLFIRLGLNARFWQRLLPILVCVADFFATCYWDTKEHKLCAYHPRHLFHPVTSDAILRHLAQRYRGATVSCLAATFSTIVGQALHSDPGISIPTRPAKEFEYS